MAKKKKKMTKSQAAAARREDGPKRSYVAPVAGKDSGPKDKNTLFTLIVPLASIALIVVLSIVFTVGPGIVLGR